MKFSYTTTDVCRIFDIKKECLRQWMTDGFIVPSKPSDGPGLRAIFSLPDLYRIYIFQSFLNADVKRSTSADLVRQIPDDELLEADKVEFDVWQLPKGVVKYVIDMKNVIKSVKSKLKGVGIDG